MSFGENLNELIERKSNGILGIHSTWKRVRVGDIAILTNGFAYKSNHFNSESGTPLLRIRDILNGSPGTFYSAPIDDPKMKYVSDGDIVIGMDGDFNSRIWFGSRALINQRVCTLRANEQFYCQKFLAYALPGYLKLINDHTSSVTVKHLSSRTVQDIPLPLPSLNEQRRIVEKIEALFARIDKGEEALREVRKLLKRYRQSILKAAVTGELTRDWRQANKDKLEPASELLARILQSRRENWQGRGKYKEPVAPDTVNLPELPEGWIWATLPMLGEFGRGKSKHRPRNDEKLYEDGQYPFLQTGTVRNSNGHISKYDRLYNEFGLSQSKLWPAGTICITIAANIAESGILEIDACFPDSVVGLVPHQDICGEYLETFIRTAKEDLDRYAPATAQKNINLEILNVLAVSLPPAEEQLRIQDELKILLSAADFLDKTCEIELARSASLRQSILKSAFNGKLVSQNPSDEPASELLARIRAEA